MTEEVRAQTDPARVAQWEYLVQNTASYWPRQKAEAAMRLADEEKAPTTRALDAAMGAIRAVLALHHEVSDAFTYPQCRACGCDWPCATGTILREGLKP